MKLISTESLNNWIGNWLAKHKYYHPHSRCNSIPISELKDILNLMPEVEAEPVRHAYWIKKMTVKLCVGFDMYEPHWFCSNCKQKYEPTFAQICKYCYVCGSKMDGKRPDA